MTEKPILFSSPMVRAILDGTKTQTRRVLKGKKAFADMLCAQHIENVGGWPIAREYDRSWPIRTGYKPGDRLWVRETWRPRVDPEIWMCVEYQTDGARIKPCIEDGGQGYRFEQECGSSEPEVPWHDPKKHLRWRPSIHMPRWASRITLLVKEVRVERLQSISEEDAKAEGIEAGYLTDLPLYHSGVGRKDVEWTDDPTDAFAQLWDSINGKRPGCSWADNPWVAAISFEVMI